MSGDTSARVRLRGFLAESAKVDVTALGDEEPLISSGRLDSLALFNLAVWIEQEIGEPVAISDVVLPEGWDSVSRILHFIEERRPRRA